MFASPRAGARMIAIDLSSSQFTAVQLGAMKRGVRVGGRVCVDIPPDVEPSDDEWLGKWMARTMEEHGLGRAPAVFVVPRQSVGLKHLTLPSTRLDELPGMVAIKMAGQLPFPAEGSIIDYAVVAETQGSSEVIAAAARHELIDRYRALAEAGRLKLARIALRPLATGALIAEFSRRRSGALLAIDLRRYGEVELVVACNGVVRFARAAEVIASSEEVDRHEEARRLATEAKRSWMSFRATEEAPDVDHIVVIGADGLAGAVAAEVRSSLGRPTEVLLSHPAVDGEASTLGSVWPLVGVALQCVEGVDGVDFLNPKRAPDLAARRRQRLLAGAAAGVILLGGAYTLGNFHLRRLEDRLAALKEESKDLLPDYLSYERARLRLEHLRRWEKAGFDWLEHLAFISDHLPPTDQAILGSFSASMSDSAIRWTKGQWIEPAPIATITFNGAAVSRPIADAIRSSFVSEKAYETTPIGTDTSSNDKTYLEAFNLRLRTLKATPYERALTREPAPADSPPTSAPADEGGGSGAAAEGFEFGGVEAPSSGAPPVEGAAAPDAEPAPVEDGGAAGDGARRPANSGSRPRRRNPREGGGG